MEEWRQTRDSSNSKEEETLQMVEKRYEQSKNLETDHKFKL